MTRPGLSVSRRRGNVKDLGKQQPSTTSRLYRFWRLCAMARGRVMENRPSPAAACLCAAQFPRCRDHDDGNRDGEVIRHRMRPARRVRQVWPTQSSRMAAMTANWPAITSNVCPGRAFVQRLHLVGGRCASSGEAGFAIDLDSPGGSSV